MRILLIVTAFIEVATGLALAAWPSVPVALLLGSSLETPAGIIVARLAGAALLSLGVACWLARCDEQSRSTTGLVAALLLYNAAAASLLVFARLGLGLDGILLWPGVALHAVLAVWCIACLRNKLKQQADTHTEEHGFK
ncbi:MAG TPA: hypothetical protein VGZ22_06685 [Isosphaeraceae bacterium]|jgi:hypothetical protein|nr:hypothetical protein [Isosphaeraceae bacterium]